MLFLRKSIYVLCFVDLGASFVCFGMLIRALPCCIELVLGFLCLCPICVNLYDSIFVDHCASSCGML
jgi:hypothetical protein